MSSFGLLLISLLFISCNDKIDNKFNTDSLSVGSESLTEIIEPIIPAAERLNLYLPILKNKRVGVVVNQTSIINSVHLVDTLLNLNVDIHRIFAPEHGFKGAADAGEKVADGMYGDIEVVSLYGKNRRPNYENRAECGNSRNYKYFIFRLDLPFVII